MQFSCHGERVPDARAKHPDIDGVSPADAAIVARAERQHGVVAAGNWKRWGFAGVRSSIGSPQVGCTVGTRVSMQWGAPR